MIYAVTVHCQQLDRLNKQLHKKWPTLVNRKDVIFQHDNVHSGATKQTQEKI